MLAGSSGQSTGYEINQSIRFNQADNASMSRTPSSASSRTTWTFSWWWKRGNLSGSTNGTNQRQPIFGTTAFSILSNHNSTQIDGINVVYTGAANDIQTSEKYRDVSAWYHFVFVLDTTNDIPTERVRLYKNGERVTSFASITYPSKDTTYTVNNTQVHYIGFRNSGENLDGYLPEIHFVDGYAYDPSYFGEFDDFDNWIPKQYSGSYGTNGFKIDGRDSSDLGDDESGNGNDFTTSGLAADDQQPDSPTNNHAVFNPLDVASNGFTDFSEGNLAISYSGSSARELARSTITIPANTDGFFFFFITADLGSGVDFAIGIEDGSALQDASNTTYTNGYIIREDGTFSTSGSGSTSSYGTSFDQNDVVGVWRKANGDLVFYKNGTAMNSGTPAVTGVTGEMHFVAGGFNGGAGIARFSSDQWTNTPTGVSSSMALTTKNLFG